MTDAGLSPTAAAMGTSMGSQPKPSVLERKDRPGGLPSNPFATRFTCPGALTYRFVTTGGCGNAASEGFESRAVGFPLEGLSETDHRQAVDQLVRGVIETRAGLIVGPHGTGKSTLLRTLMPVVGERFSEVQHLRLDGGPTQGVRDRWCHARQVGRQAMAAASQAGRDALLVIDGIEQLRWWQRRRLLWTCRRRDQAVLATSHRCLPGMQVLYVTRIHANLIHDLIDRLLDQASPEVEALVRAELERRDLGRVSNLRDFWFELYDLVQPALLSAHVPQVSKILHGRPLVRHHDSFTSADRRCPADV